MTALDSEEEKCDLTQPHKTTVFELVRSEECLKGQFLGHQILSEAREMAIKIV